MAQRIVIECDLCLAQREALTEGDVVEEGLPVVVTISLPGERTKPLEVDLCGTHRKPLADLLAELSGLGARPAPQRRAAAPVGAEPASAAPGGFACPACAHTVATLGGLRDHARKMHSRTLEELEAGGTLPFACHCGRTFARPQAIAVHASRTKDPGPHGLAERDD